ncbi:class I adenylate-forming enzyme family protein [Eubacterium pyruvativorans]|uniref:class I adenylate-forming enzyme family protein n=1 Tax=Eubacterium pyruvativorans TaxID=155865 RepID=UPI0023F54BAE|nr:class I adenylate-forming enzyme family protein [Eubacterium pyruvativorans]MCI5747274.1 acyl--CoA ligase [Eubacterium pyruvativorans]MDD7685064.1 class I adenylate-forming enzyme family protein [Eubacterium pyruvativorans]
MMNQNSIVELLAGWAMERPDVMCAADTKGSATYREMMQMVYYLSEMLRAEGVKEGDPVVVECTQDRAYLALYLAIELAHGVFVPLESGAADARATDIIDDTEAKLYFTQKEYEGRPGWRNGKELKKLAADTLTEEKTAAFGAVDLTKLPYPDPEAVSQILYSTGTTGKSKGIVLTHRNNVACAENVRYGVEMKEQNVEFIPMPLSHSHGLRTAYASILNGSGMVLMNGVMFVKIVYDLMDRYHVTGFDMSPSILRLLFRLSKDKIAEYNDQLDYVEIGSAALPEEDKEHLKELLPDVRLYDFYGSSESGRSCVLNFNSPDDKPKCIGRPSHNTSFVFTDDQRREIHATEDNPGLLASKGAMNMKGYFKNPELTASVMKDGYIYTNDLCYVGEDGLIYYLGRQDDVINCSGVKISPEEVEEVVRHYPNVKDCCCIPVDDPLKGQAPKVFLQMEEGAPEFRRADFMKYCKTAMDATKQPAEVELIDSIPRTYNGKLQRKKLIAREKERRA